MLSRQIRCLAKTRFSRCLSSYVKDPISLSSALSISETEPTFRPLLPFLHLSLENGDLPRARRIFNSIRESSPQLLLNEPELERDICIAFMDAYLERGGARNAKEALKVWTDARSRGLEVSLNMFAVLIRGFLRNHMPSAAWILLKEMQKPRSGEGGGWTLEELYRTPYFEDEDVHLVEQLLASSSSPIVRLDDVVTSPPRVSSTPKEPKLDVAKEDIKSVVTASNTLNAPEKQEEEDIIEPVSTNVLGIRLLKKSLSASMFSDPSLKHGHHTPGSSLYALQIALESQAVSAALERLRAQMNTAARPNTSLPQIRRYMWSWHQKLVERIIEERKKVEDSFGSRGSHRGRGLELLYGMDADRVALTVISSMLRLLGTQGVFDGTRAITALVKVGRDVELEYRAFWYRKRKKWKRSKNPIASELEMAHVEEFKKAFGNEFMHEWPLVSDTAEELAKQFEESKKREALLMTAEDRKKELERLERRGGPERWIPTWPASLRVRVAGSLIAMFMDIAKVTVDIEEGEAKASIDRGQVEMSALYHSYLFEKGVRVGVLRWHEKVLQAVSHDSLQDGLNLDARFLPMLVPPKPWIAYNIGGYLAHETILMRHKGSHQQLEYLKQASDRERLGTLYQGLDVLGLTAWRIHRRVFKTVLEAWNSRKKFPSIPPMNEKLVLPPKPDDPNEIQSWRLKTTKLRNDFRNDHSLRCDVNYKVEIARAFLDHVLYFPHNVDFRGRAYPIPPLFNHLGNDLCRGLLIFAEGRPLGKNGLNWIKVQIANLQGFDKHSFEDRIKFADTHLEDIRKSAANPLSDDGRWWMNADDPWQCLAACIELVDAIDSEDPETFISHLPIHQDGTCNGLQHYAALGGDRYGAEHVNLVPGIKPKDIYSEVLKLVTQKVHAEAENGVPEAITLDGKLSRKIIKQTVMTNVYGVTFIGAKDQIRNRLKEVPELQDHDIPRLAQYLTGKVFSSLGEMFTGARGIQDWLNEAAGRIAKSVPIATLDEIRARREEHAEALKLLKAPTQPSSAKKMVKKLVKEAAEDDAEEAELIADEITMYGKLSAATARDQLVKQLKELENQTMVVWTTPLGLPIVQPYRKDKGKQIRTEIQIVTIRDPNTRAVVNTRKQKTAFPPNFIHSLDATHMLLSAVECHRAGLVFAAVHDSYWTHAADVEKMATRLREQFIRLHTQPLMQNLCDEFMERYKGFVMPANIVDKFEAKQLSKEMSSEVKLDDQSTDVGEEEAVDLDIDHNEDDEVDELAEDDSETSKVEKRTHSNRWTPFELPPLPKRGEFDVSQVAQSPYFFH